MATGTYLGIALLVIAAAYLIRRARSAARAWKFHGRMLVICPETGKPAAVRVATFRAALGALVNRGKLELSDCSRWPERRDCDQDCLTQIAADAKNHRVWEVASQWYAGKNCVYCHKPIEKPSYLDHRSALLNIPTRTTIEWDQLPAEELPEAFSQWLPVCWSCHMTETFLRKCPDRAIVRPWAH